MSGNTENWIFSKQWDKEYINFFSDRRKGFPISKDNKHEKVMSWILYCKQLHLYIYIYIQNRLPREVVGNYFKIRLSKVPFLTHQLVTSSLFFSKIQLHHTHY